MKNQPVTVPAIKARKNSGKKITALTAYDFSFAKLLDTTAIDILLVGDSLGMVSQGIRDRLKEERTGHWWWRICRSCLIRFL